MAPYVPRPPLVINCLDDKPWFPIGTRGQGYCVITPLPLPSKTYSFATSSQKLIGTNWGINVLITSIQVFLSMVYLHDDGFSYMCNLEP